MIQVPIGLALLMAAAPQVPPSTDQTQPNIKVELTSEEMLRAAARALSDNHPELAQRLLMALISDPRMEIRNEARFRLADLAARKRHWQKAGQYLRDILDEDPQASRVRLELARIQAEMGDIEGSRRSLREAQAGGLPPDVAQAVERFSNTLRARKPFGVNVQLAIAPDSNINRATRSTTLGTVLGEFDIDENARRTSGLGLKLAAEAYWRRPVAKEISVVARAGITGDLYGRSEYNDVGAIVSIGPEFPLLKGRASSLLGGQQRWFGGEAYYRSFDASLQWQRPLGRRSQLRAGLSYSQSNNLVNDLQDAETTGLTVGYETALSARSGVALNIAGIRQAAADPAYATWQAQASLTGWRDFGSSTLFANARYSRLEADERLSIYPRRRQDDSFSGLLGATFRSLAWKGWAPQVKVLYERNDSPIEVYRYDRWRSEFGVVKTF